MKIQGRKSFRYLIGPIAFGLAFGVVSMMNRGHGIEDEAKKYFRTAAAQDIFISEAKPLLSSSAYKKAISSAKDLNESMAIGARLSADGLTRLSDPILFERSILYEKILREAGQSDCSAIARGAIPTDATAAPIFRAMERIPLDDMRRWLNISMQSMASEVNH